MAPQTFPGEYDPKPAWVVYADFEPAHTADFIQSAELADDQRAFAYSVEPGPHAIYTYTGGLLWFCAPFEATAAQ